MSIEFFSFFNGSLIDQFANIALSFSHISQVLFIFAIGFLFYDRNIFFHAIAIAAFGAIVNVALKGTFKMPLSADLLKVGYAFPSGHMQFSTVFYGWIALMMPYWSIRILIFLLLTSIGFGLVHFDYHTLFDVVGGLTFGGGLIGLYWYALTQLPHYSRYFMWGVLGSAGLLMIYNAYIYTYLSIPSHAWDALNTLIALTLFKPILNYLEKYKQSLKPKSLRQD